MTKRAANPGIREDNIMKRVFLNPAVAVLLLFSIFPLLWSLGISFTDLQRGGSTVAREATSAGIEEPVGFLGMGFDVTGRNYESMLDDTRLHTASRNTLFYVIGGVIVQYTIGLLLAILLNQQFFGRNIFRVIFLMPMMMTPVAAAYAGRMMFDSNISRSPMADFINEVGQRLGAAANYTIPWLSETNLAPIAVLIVDSWQWIPFMTLLLLAGLQSIPDDIYEAARVDGAPDLAIFLRITFPILLPISITVVLIRGLEIFKIIDVIQVMTGGGPGSSTESLTMYIKDVALEFGNYGYAAAISFVLLVFVVLFATTFLAIGRRINPMTKGES